MKIIDDIVLLRKKRGITQQQLSELSGIKQPMIARIESGKSDPQLSTIIKILDCLEARLIVDDKYEEE